MNPWKLCCVGATQQRQSKDGLRWKRHWCSSCYDTIASSPIDSCEQCTDTLFNSSLGPSHSLTRELEKKFSDRHVVFVGQRRILGKPSRKNRNQQPRPHSRTLTAVHESILEDLVYPSEITGKRTRVATDGSRLIKCFLDSKDATSLEYKLDSFSSVYKKLTGRDVTFMFSSDN